MSRSLEVADIFRAHGAAWREADLLPVEYYHLVFTLPAPISDIAYYNKAVIYHILFRASSYRCGCYRGCSDACFSMNSKKPT